MNFKKTVPIHVNSDIDCYDQPTHATITLDTTGIKRIRQLARAVKKIGVTYIEEFDRTPILKEGRRVWDGSVDCVCLKVSDDDFHYTGYFKNSQLQWETQGIPLNKLSR